MWYLWVWLLVSEQGSQWEENDAIRFVVYTPLNSHSTSSWNTQQTPNLNLLLEGCVLDKDWCCCLKLQGNAYPQAMINKINWSNVS